MRRRRAFFASSFRPFVQYQTGLGHVSLMTVMQGLDILPLWNPQQGNEPESCEDEF
jgi:hypothetical protein